MTNLQQMSKTICYVQEHGFDTKADMEHDRQMNITALNKLTVTLRNTDDRISRIKSSPDSDGHHADQLDILQQTRTQLLVNQKALKQNIRNLQIVEANVDAMMNYSPEQTRGKETIRNKETTQDR